MSEFGQLPMHASVSIHRSLQAFHPNSKHVFTARYIGPVLPFLSRECPVNSLQLRALRPSLISRIRTKGGRKSWPPRDLSNNRRAERRA
jgi:hypothetical protein